MLLMLFLQQTAATEIYTLSLHDALPICERGRFRAFLKVALRRFAIDEQRAAAAAKRGGGERMESTDVEGAPEPADGAQPDRKSTRLNSSHSQISYAVFCLKKKKKNRVE